MQQQTLTLDLEKVFHYAEKGIIRAAFFSGIVLNQNNTINIQDWNISDGICLIPKLFNENEVLKEFNIFVSKNALREMIELFEKTLIGIYEILNITKNPIILSEIPKITKETKKFKGKKFPDKLKIIDEFLNNLLSKQSDFWQGLQDIRNCITHNISIVYKEEIIINIPKFNAIIKGKKTGKEIHLPFGVIKDGVLIDEEAELLVKIEHIKRTFKKGDVITFTNDEIALIIFGMQNSLAILRKTVVEVLLERNIPVTDKSANRSFKTIDELEKYKKEISKKESNRME